MPAAELDEERVREIARAVFKEWIKTGLKTIGLLFLAILGVQILASSFNNSLLLLPIGLIAGSALVLWSLRSMFRLHVVR